MPVLKIREDHVEREVPVRDDAVTIGRAPGNAVVISDPSSSKEHCRIERDGDRWKMVDLESKNGTRVNGVFKNRAFLHHADTIRIGQAEVRFELTNQDMPRSGRKGASRSQAYQDEEREAPRRRRTGTEADLLLRVGLILVGVLVIIIVANNMASGLVNFDDHAQIRKTAERMRTEGYWEQAAVYLEQNMDSTKSGYEVTRKLLEDTYIHIPDYHSQRSNYESRRLYFELSRDIRRYHKGSETITPAIIIKRVDRMRRQYADTEFGQLARENYPAWFAGKVPERGFEAGPSSDAADQAWEVAMRQSKEFEHRWMFRESREIIQRFLVTHETVLNARRLALYRGREKEELNRLDNAAGSVYTSERQRAHNFVKNKRYNEAIKIYKKIIDSFGIDSYIRKAQTELESVKHLKSQGG
ncbi:MAG: FHA domain-containing protein [Planctomycetota bacterium]|nr:FHA domain-containing protein [Planctomycetota bacterium]